MPTTKIADHPAPCTHPDHDPQKHRLSPGIYVHHCPGCHHDQHFSIPLPGSGDPARSGRGGNH